MMNIKTLIAIFGLFLFAGAFDAAGQTREITEEEYYKVYREANARSRSAAWRSEMTSLHFDKKDSQNPIRERGQIIETAANGDSRKITTAKDRNHTTKIEELEIGDDFYERKNDEPWVKLGDDDYGEDAFVIKGDGHKPVEQTTISRYLGKLESNGQTVEAYEISKFRNIASGGNDGDYKYTEIETLWIDESRRIVKKEVQVFRDDKTIEARTTYIYEYPEEIKIVTPIK